MLYFAYTARIDPVRMAAVAPGAEFRCIAHLPEHGLEWPIADGGWGGGLPSITPNPAATVWGAVLAVPDPEFSALDQVESSEGRAAATTQVIDRTGKRHNVTVHVAPVDGNGNGHQRPSASYVALMLDGSRHWSLPVGWIASLEEHLAPMR